MSAPAGINLGIDIGTSSCKVVAVDPTGAMVASATREYPLYSPRHGWSEQNPEDWWVAVDECIQQITSMLPHLGGEVVAIGLSGQMHGLVALDADNRVLRRAILWNDQRCEAECVSVTDAVGGPGAVLAEIDNRLITGFTAGKIVWLAEHEPAIFARTERLLNPKDYVRLRMNGQFVTDVSEASGTGLFDVAGRRWSARMLEAVGVSEAMLPAVVESTAPTGRVLPAIAQRWNVPADVEVYGGGGDAVVQTVSMGITKLGDIGVTLGTAGIICAVAPECPDNATGNVQLSCYNAPGLWHVMGVSLSAAGALQWLTDVLNEVPGTHEVGFPAVIDVAKDVPVGANGLLFLPYLAGERAPHYAPSASGALVGLTRMHGLGHIVRAVIEGVLLNMREILESFIALGIRCERIVASGGATRDPFWLQTMADVFGTEVVTMMGGSEGGAYGAALVSGVGTGTWESFNEVLDRLHVSARYLPDGTNAERYSRIYSGYRNLFEHLADVYRDIEVARGDQ